MWRWSEVQLNSPHLKPEGQGQAEARGLKPIGFKMKLDGEGWTQARLRSAEKRKGEAIVDYINEKIKKSKTEMEIEKCYECG